jgi:hypothetical protein
MKTGFKKNSKWFFATLLLTFCMNVFSQKSITWKGGTPGQKNEWYCAQNWSTHNVPDEFSDVIIPDVSTSSFAFPIIRTGKVEINSLYILFNGSLTIAKNAVMTVLDNAEGCSQGKIHGDGLIILHNVNPEKELKRIASNID